MVENRSVFVRGDRLWEEINYKRAKGTFWGDGIVLRDSMIVVVVTRLCIYICQSESKSRLNFI